MGARFAAAVPWVGIPLGLALGVLASMVVAELGEELAYVPFGPLDGADAGDVGAVIAVLVVGSASVVWAVRRRDTPVGPGLALFAAGLPIGLFLEGDLANLLGTALVCAGGWACLAWHARAPTQAGLVLAATVAAFFTGPTAPAIIAACSTVALAAATVLQHRLGPSWLRPVAVAVATGWIAVAAWPGWSIVREGEHGSDLPILWLGLATLVAVAASAAWSARPLLPAKV